MLTGMLAAVALRGALSRLLFGVTAFDPVSYLTAVTALGCVAFAAVVLPASRASRMDPVKALRHE